MKKAMTLFAVMALMLMAFAGFANAQDDVSGELEIFSWWTGGGEEAGLNALIEEFSSQYPNVEIINAAVAGGSGVNARAVLTNRMLGGDPPSTFQVHAGEELNAVWVAAGRMQPLNDLYEANNWFEDYPQGLIDQVSDAEGNVYSVPVNIHRSNVLWYVPANLEEWGVSVPADWNEFINETCPTLQEAGVTPITVGETWTQVHLWESVALASLGVEGYNGLWDGSTDWMSDEVLALWDTYSAILDCANDDAGALSWQDASQRVANGEAAFNIMGDWAAGYFLVDLALEPNEGFSWAASPGTDGVFMWLSDSFGLPVEAPNEEATLAWLAFLGSAEGQDIFNPLKGSLPANTTADIENEDLYNAYFQSAYSDWVSNDLVGSLAHGTVASPDFLNGFSNVIAEFLTTRDGELASETAVEIAEDAGIGG